MTSREMFKVKACIYKILKTYFGKCGFHFVGERICGFSPKAHIHRARTSLSRRHRILAACSVDRTLQPAGPHGRVPFHVGSRSGSGDGYHWPCKSCPYVVGPPFWNRAFSEKKKGRFLLSAICCHLLTSNENGLASLDEMKNV